MSDFKPRTTIEANLETKTIDAGTMYVTTDTKRLYVDTNDSRILIDGNIYLETEAKRNMILAPLSNKLYIVKDTGKIYLYTTEWIELGLGNSSKSSGCSIPVGTILCMPFGVDESENKFRYLNGQLMQASDSENFISKLKTWKTTRANMFTTESNWQSEKSSSKLGQCGKFVLNYKTESTTTTWAVFTTIFDGDRIVKKPASEVVVGDIAYDWDSSTKTVGTTEYVITNIWGGVKSDVIIGFESAVSNGFGHESDGSNDYTFTSTVETDEIESVRLPLVINIAGLTELANCGNIANQPIADVTSGSSSIVSEAIQYPFVICIDSDEQSSSSGTSSVSESTWTLISKKVLLSNTELPKQSNGTYTVLKVDLSPYLPEDDNYYELMLSMRATSTSSSGNLAVWGVYDFIIPELSDTFTTVTHEVQIMSTTGTGLNGGQFLWLTGPRRLLQIWSSYSVAGSIKNLVLSGYRKIPKPTVIYNT